MICTGTHDPNIDSITFIPSGKAIDDINPGSSVQVVDSALSVNFPYLSVDARQHSLGKHEASIKTIAFLKGFPLIRLEIFQCQLEEKEKDATDIGCHWFIDRTPPHFLL